jgi:hypothetical protein
VIRQQPPVDQPGIGVDCRARPLRIRLARRRHRRLQCLPDRAPVHPVTVCQFPDRGALDPPVLLGLAPAAGVLDKVPAGYRDYIVEVGRYTDSLPAYAPIRRSDAASVDGTTFREWGSLAHEVAVSPDLRAGDRLLIDVAEHEHPLKWLLAPLAAGASVVLCANLDPATVDARAAAEQVTRVL